MTIKDIAKKAGVSIATVSRVINNYKWVSPELRERVLKIIEEENYHPSYNASVMATGKSNIIVIIVPDIASPFFAQFTSTASKILKMAGYATFLVQTDNDAAEEESFFTGPFIDVADGLISVTDSMDEADIIRLIRPLRKKDKPVLFVDRYIPTYIADSSTHNTKNAVSCAMEMLFLEGHQRVGLILGSKGKSVIKDKLDGYRSALSKWGYDVDEELISFGDWTAETGQAETQRLLSLPRKVTAIIAGNDAICEGVVSALELFGKKAGKDFSLIGFEESPSDKRLFDRLGISTFRLNPVEMAIDACEFMLRSLGADAPADAEYQSKEFPVCFIDRGSVTKPSNRSIESTQ